MPRFRAWIEIGMYASQRYLGAPKFRTACFVGVWCLWWLSYGLEFRARVSPICESLTSDGKVGLKLAGALAARRNGLGFWGVRFRVWGL